MAFTNHSKLVVNQETLTELLCSAQLTEGIHNELRWISLVNYSFIHHNGFWKCNSPLSSFEGVCTSPSV